jgi:hypothetical protein
LKYEIIFHNFVCRSFCRSFPTPAPAKYAGAPAPVLFSEVMTYIGLENIDPD